MQDPVIYQTSLNLIQKMKSLRMTVELLVCVSYAKEKEKKNWRSKMKKLLSFILIIFISTSFLGCGQDSDTKKRNEAVVKHIEPIMSKYNITQYSVNDFDDGWNFFNVYTEEIENLSHYKKALLLYELTRISSIADPCGGETISFSTPNISPNKDCGYYYYLVSAIQVKYGKNNYKYPGLYRSDISHVLLIFDN